MKIKLNILSKFRNAICNYFVIEKPTAMQNVATWYRYNKEACLYLYIYIGKSIIVKVIEISKTSLSYIYIYIYAYEEKRFWDRVECFCP